MLSLCWFLVPPDMNWVQTAEQEIAIREQQVKNEDQGAGSSDLIGRNEKAKKSKWKVCSSIAGYICLSQIHTKNTCVTFHQNALLRCHLSI